MGLVNVNNKWPTGRKGMWTMPVETFECEETATEEIEESTEARELIERLGLDGQKQLNSPDQKGRFPYRLMTAEEEFVYRIICPKETKLGAYADSPIPLRVLQVASHANELFDKIVVWHRASPAIKDPVLVGYKKNPTRSWHDGDLFILARWGEILEEWPMLLKTAMAAWRESYRGQLVEIKSQVASKLIESENASLAQAIKLGSRPVFSAA